MEGGMCLRDPCGFGGQQDRAESEIGTGCVKSNSPSLGRALCWGDEALESLSVC